MKQELFTKAEGFVNGDLVPDWPGGIMPPIEPGSAWRNHMGQRSWQVGNDRYALGWKVDADNGIVYSDVAASLAQYGYAGVTNRKKLGHPEKGWQVDFDMEIELRLRVFDPAQSAAMMVIAWSTDTAESPVMYLMANFNSYGVQYTDVDSIPADKVVVTLGDFSGTEVSLMDFPYSAWNKLRFDKRGHMLRMFINDKYVDEIDGSLYSPGWQAHGLLEMACESRFSVAGVDELAFRNILIDYESAGAKTWFLPAGASTRFQRKPTTSADVRRARR